jgi:hypothetical protein
MHVTRECTRIFYLFFADDNNKWWQIRQQNLTFVSWLIQKKSGKTPLETIHCTSLHKPHGIGANNFYAHAYIRDPLKSCWFLSLNREGRVHVPIIAILLHVDVGKDIEVKLKEMALPQKLKVSPKNKMVIISPRPVVVNHKRLTEKICTIHNKLQW